MLKGQALDLGHVLDAVASPGRPGDRIEHTACNRSAGGTLGKERRRLRPSRAW